MLDKQSHRSNIDPRVLFKLGDNIIRFGMSSSNLRTHAYQDIVMNEKHIVDLHDPVNVQDAATKSYVDTALTSANPQDFATKNYVDSTLNSHNPEDFATKNYVETALSSVNANPLKKMSHTKFRERCK